MTVYFVYCILCATDPSAGQLFYPVTIQYIVGMEKSLIHPLSIQDFHTIAKFDCHLSVVDYMN